MELPPGTINEKLEYMRQPESQHIVFDGIEINVLTLGDAYRLHLDAKQNGGVFYSTWEWDDGQMDEIMWKVGILFELQNQ